VWSPIRSIYGGQALAVRGGGEGGTRHSVEDGVRFRQPGEGNANDCHIITPGTDIFYGRVYFIIYIYISRGSRFFVFHGLENY
jgi:hypothetical protein